MTSNEVFEGVASRGKAGCLDVHANSRPGLFRRDGGEGTLLSCTVAIGLERLNRTRTSCVVFWIRDPSLWKLRGALARRFASKKRFGT